MLMKFQTNNVLIALLTRIFIWNLRVVTIEINVNLNKSNKEKQCKNVREQASYGQCRYTEKMWYVTWK